MGMEALGEGSERSPGIYFLMLSCATFGGCGSIQIEGPRNWWVLQTRTRMGFSHINCCKRCICKLKKKPTVSSTCFWPLLKTPRSTGLPSHGAIHQGSTKGRALCCSHQVSTFKTGQVSPRRRRLVRDLSKSVPSTLCPPVVQQESLSESERKQEEEAKHLQRPPHEAGERKELSDFALRMPAQALPSTTATITTAGLARGMGTTSSQEHSWKCWNRSRKTLAPLRQKAKRCPFTRQKAPHCSERSFALPRQTGSLLIAVCPIAVC